MQQERHKASLPIQRLDKQKGGHGRCLMTEGSLPNGDGEEGTCLLTGEIWWPVQESGNDSAIASKPRFVP